MEALIKAKFIEDAQFNGKLFEVNKTYWLPYDIARALQKEGYCTFIEKAIISHKETSKGNSIIEVNNGK